MSVLVMYYLTLGRTRKLTHPSWYKEGEGEGGLQPLSWVFAVLQCLENSLPFN